MAATARYKGNRSLSRGGEKSKFREIPGTPYLFPVKLLFPPWLLPLQDTTQRSFKLSNKTIVSQGSACLLMTAYPLDLFFGHATQKKVPPIPDHFKQGLDLHQIVASA